MLAHRHVKRNLLSIVLVRKQSNARGGGVRYVATRIVSRHLNLNFAHRQASRTVIGNRHGHAIRRIRILNTGQGCARSRVGLKDVVDVRTGLIEGDPTKTEGEHLLAIRRHKGAFSGGSVIRHGCAGLTLSSVRKRHLGALVIGFQNEREGIARLPSATIQIFRANRASLRGQRRRHGSGLIRVLESHAVNIAGLQRALSRLALHNPPLTVNLNARKDKARAKGIAADFRGLRASLRTSKLHQLIRDASRQAHDLQGLAMLQREAVRSVVGVLKLNQGRLRGSIRKPLVRRERASVGLRSLHAIRSNAEGCLEGEVRLLGLAQRSSAQPLVAPHFLRHRERGGQRNGKATVVAQIGVRVGGRTGIVPVRVDGHVGRAGSVTTSSRSLFRAQVMEERNPGLTSGNVGMAALVIARQTIQQLEGVLVDVKLLGRLLGHLANIRRAS